MRRRVGRWIRGLAGLGLAGALLLVTPAGPGALLGVARLLAPGSLHWDWVDGSLSGPLELRGLAWHAGSRRLRIDRLRIDWRPWRLLAGVLEVRALSLQGLRWQGGASSPAKEALPLPRLPLALRLAHLEVEDAVLERAHAPPLRLAYVQGRGARLEGRRLTLAGLDVQGPRGRLHLAGWVEAGARPRLALSARAQAAGGRLRRVEARWWGPLARARFQARLELEGLPEPVRLAGTLGWSRGRLAWQALRIQAGAGMGGISEGWLQPRLGGFDVRLRQGGFAWPLQGGVRLQGREGSLHLHGRWEDWRLEAALALAGPGLPPSRWRLAGRGGPRRFRLERLEGRLLRGTLAGQGTLAWYPRLGGQLRLQGAGLDPSAWPDARAAGWPGRLALTLELAARATPSGPRLECTLERLTGRLRGHPLEGRGRLRLSPGHAVLEGLEVRSGGARIGVVGTVRPARLALAWHARVPRLEDWLPGAQGRLVGAGQVQGPRARPRLSGWLSGRALRYRGHRLARISARWDLGVRPRSPLHLRVEARDLRLADTRWSTVHLSVQGTAGSHRLRGEAQGPAGRIRLRLAGGLAATATAWTGRLARADWLQGPLGDWHLAAPARLQWREGRLQGGPLCWRLQAARLCLTPGTGPQGRRVRLRLQRLPVRRLAPLYPRLAELDVQAHLDGEVEFLPRPPFAAEGRLCLAPGSLRVTRGGRTRREPFTGGCLEGRWRAEGALRLQGRLAFDARNRLAWAIRLPGERPGRPWVERPLTGRVRVHLDDLGRLQPWLEGIDRLAGRVTGDGVLAGTPAHPVARVRLHWEEGSLGLPATGTEWTGMDWTLSGDLAHGLHLAGRVRSGTGRVQVTGILAFQDADPADWRLRLTVRGRAFLAVALPEAHLWIDPDLRLALQPGRIALRGTVHVPRATLKPHRLTQPVAVSPDAVLVGDAGEENARRWHLHGRVRLVLGSAVHLQARGLDARLGGDLEVTDRGDGVPLGRGRLEVREGTYRLQGTPLKIRTGRLLFIDSPLDDPGLDIVLERDTGKARVQAHIGGTLRAPKLRLGSTPPLPQGEQLALLLTGHGLGTLGTAQARLLQEAARELGVAGGRLLSTRLRTLLGISEARIALGDSLDEAALALGTWLSPRLYVSWTLGLFDPTAALHLRYRLGRHLQIEVRSGAEGTGGDLLYTLEK